MKGSSIRSHGARRGPRTNAERAQAWLYLVINPLVDAVRAQARLLAQENVTFRWRRGGLEYLLEFEDHLYSDSKLVLEDLDRSDTKFVRLHKRHGECLKETTGAAVAAFEALVASQAFSKAVDSAVAGVEDDSLKEAREWLAQRVVNNLGTISDQYPLFDVWNINRVKLREFATGPTFAKLAAARAALGKLLVEIESHLTALRDKLINQFDISPVPLTG